MELRQFINYGAAAFGAGVTNYFVVDCNSTYLPFTSGVNWSAATNGSATGVGGSAITQALPGNSYLSGLYKTYRVLKSSIRVSAMPESAGDALIIQIFAYNASSSLSLPLNMAQCATQLANKMKVCAVGTAAKFNTVASTVMCHDVLGMSRAEYESQPPTATGSATGAPIACYWAVQACTADGLASGVNGIPMMIDLAIDVEWQNPNIPLV